jgi:glutaredoxin
METTAATPLTARQRAIAILLLTMLAVSAGLNVVLTRHILHSRSLASLPRQRAALDVGDGIEVLPIIELDSTPNYLDFSGDHLLFIFSTKCPFCKGNVRYWRQLQSRNPKIPAVYLSLNSVAETAEFVKAEKISNERVVVLRSDAQGMLKSRTVPQTLLISNRRVINSRIGMLSENAVFHTSISLPDR